MNISLQKIISSGTVQQQNPRTDANPLYNISFDKVTFDSFMNNFKAELAGKVPEQAEYRPAGNEDQYAHGTDKISRKEEAAGNQNKIDDQKYDSRHEEADRSAETNDKEYSKGSGEISGNKDQTDQYADTEDQLNGSGTVVTENDSAQLDDAETDSNEGETKRVNGLNTAALLFAMANNHAGVLNGEGETAANEGNVSADNSGTEKGMKTGALLFDMSKGMADAAKTAAAEGNAQVDNSLKTENSINSESGLKTGILLKELMKNSNSGSSEVQLTQETDSESGEAIKIVQTKSDSGIKAGSLVLDKLNGSQGEKNVDQTMINNQLKSDASEQSDSAKTDRELFNLSDKKADTKQNIIKDFQIKTATEADHIEENNIARTLTGKSMTALAENISRQAGARNIAESSPKTVRTANGNSSNALAGTAGVIQESGKISKGMQTAQAARPSAFQEISDRIVYVVKGNNRIGVTIENETFGKMNIHVSMNKGQVNVHINTADSMAREFVESNINQIIDSLSKNGVSVGGFSVGLKNHRNNDGSENGNAHGNREHINVETMQKNEYAKAGRYLPVNDGMVSVFA